MKSMRRAAAAVLAAALLCTLAGCRVRTGGDGDGREETEIQNAGSAEAVRDRPGEETDGEDGSRAEESGGATKENPDAYRKEYDENAPAEIVAGTDHLLHGEGEGSGMPAANEEAETCVTRLDEQAEEPAVQKTAAEEAEEAAASEDGKEAESALTYFTVLLEDRRESLYICQQARVYWETAQDYVTIHKSDPAHRMILGAGAEDVSERLKPEGLRVDAGWVARKNPDVIVKIVDRSVLGSGVTTRDAARETVRRLKSRDGWAGIEAVQSGRVLLLSEELTEAPHMQVFAMLMIAAAADETALGGISPEQALEMLAMEATGLAPEGIYYYTDREEKP